MKGSLPAAVFLLNADKIGLTAVASTLSAVHPWSTSTAEEFWQRPQWVRPARLSTESVQSSGVHSPKSSGVHSPSSLISLLSSHESEAWGEQSDRIPSLSLSHSLALSPSLSFPGFLFLWFFSLSLFFSPLSFSLSLILHNDVRDWWAT